MMEMNEELKEAFPEIDPGAKPLGARILVQLRKPKKKMTSSGIVLVKIGRAHV